MIQLPFGKVGLFRCALPLLVSALLVSCSQAPMNVPLVKRDTDGGYRFSPSLTTPGDSDLVIFAFFSGGGTRAAAFSYGVLKELAVTPLDGKLRMLDDLYAISSVSGGSFTAAYYCLYGDRIFSDYEQLFLKRNMQRSLYRVSLAPIVNARLASSHFSRSDRAAELYDKDLFHGATFADLNKADLRRPLLVINATNLRTGSTFPFTQDQFDLIGSDLSAYPISRAVAASSAVPVLLTPITLKNYSDKIAPPSDSIWLMPTRTSGVMTSMQNMLLTREKVYLDAASNPYIHLVDGGLADNLGLRNLVDTIAMNGGWEPIVQKMREAKKDKMAILVVNAARQEDFDFYRSEQTPNIKQVIRALSNSSINRYNDETLSMVKAGLALWDEQEKAAGVPESKRVKIYLISVDFRSIKDPNERRYFDSIPTRFHLPSEMVDRLITKAGDLLRESPEFQRLHTDLKKADSW
ncbi:MAG: patatin-like phospholipase family protein [Opitutaceae bacterium]|jgi:NTE family protein